MTVFLLIIVLGRAQPKLELQRSVPENEAWLSRDFDTALEILRKKPETVINLYNFGMLYEQKNDLKKAMEYYSLALSDDSTYIYSYISLAGLYIKQNQKASAKFVLLKGLQIDKENYELLLLLAKDYLLLNQEYEAEKIFKVLVDKYERELEPRTYLSQIYRRQKKYQEAMELFTIDKTVYPTARFLLEKAKVLQLMGESLKAKRINDEVCSNYPNSEELGCVNKQPVNYTPNHVFNYKIDVNEALDYKVKYGFITLGWLNVRINRTLDINGRKAYHVVFYVNSNPAFSFLISLHHIYESFIDAETLAPVESRLLTPNEKIYMLRTYFYDYKRNKFNAYLIAHDGHFHHVEKPMPKMAHDGTSILYYARGLLSNQMSDTMIVVVDEEYRWAAINYLNKREEINIKDKDINAIKIFAKVEFEGVAGMNGDAWGWFSPDGNAVPLEGKIKIILGSITLTQY